MATHSSVLAWRRDRLPTPVFLGFRGFSDGKESACSVGDLCLSPPLGRSPGGHGNHSSSLESPHGQRCLVGYSPWSRKESDMTERLSTAQQQIPHIRRIIYSVYLLVVGLFHLTYASKIHLCYNVSEFPSFLRLNNVSVHHTLYAYATVC